MANANPSRPGQIAGSGATDALWLKLFAGEVLTAFEVACKFKGTIRERSVAGQKSATFPATFRATGDYHTPGNEITGQNILSNEVIITLDDLLVAPVFVAEIDELKSYFDVRGPYSTEIGNALALLYDRTVSQTLLAASRTGEIFAGDGGGGKVVQTDLGSGHDFTASGQDLIDAVSLARQRMDTRNVPVDGVPVSAAFAPAQWYLMANTDKNLNQFFGGQSGVTQMVLKTVHDVSIIKSNAMLFGKKVTPYDSGANPTGLVGSPTAGINALPATFPAKYQGDNTNTVGIVWTEAAAGMLSLLGLQMESQWDIRRQGTLMVAKMAIGAGVLRGKCAEEIATS